MIVEVIYKYSKYRYFLHWTNLFSGYGEKGDFVFLSIKELISY